MWTFLFGEGFYILMRKVSLGLGCSIVELGSKPHDHFKKVYHYAMVVLLGQWAVVHPSESLTHPNPPKNKINLFSMSSLGKGIVKVESSLVTIKRFLCYVFSGR